MGLEFALPSEAAAWTELYRFKKESAPVAPSRNFSPTTPESVCISEILAAQKRHKIPNNLLLGLGLQEAGTKRNGILTVWPYAVNSEGRGRIFNTRSEALEFVRSETRNGVRSIDVGCMQINLRWHPDAFRSLEEGFDPARNIDYAARFLRKLYQESGDWTLAVGNYHSRTPDKRAVYTKRALRNIAVANDRIEAFRALASRSREPGEQVTELRPKVRRVRTLWSTDRSGADTRFTPYGQYELQPILPILLQGN
ncbi:Transglycosylase SLT domain protein [Roseivivax sp. THAF40]|nr:Transglycosylase SLT domain protein [Roseivivax sp. THAF40]